MSNNENWSKAVLKPLRAASVEVNDLLNKNQDRVYDLAKITLPIAVLGGWGLLFLDHDLFNIIKLYHVTLICVNWLLVTLFCYLLILLCSIVSIIFYSMSYAKAFDHNFKYGKEFSDYAEQLNKLDEKDLLQYESENFEKILHALNSFHKYPNCVTRLKLWAFWSYICGLCLVFAFFCIVTCFFYEKEINMSNDNRKSVAWDGHYSVGIPSLKREQFRNHNNQNNNLGTRPSNNPKAGEVPKLPLPTSKQNGK